MILVIHYCYFIFIYFLPIAGLGKIKEEKELNEERSDRMELGSLARSWQPAQLAHLEWRSQRGTNGKAIKRGNSDLYKIPCETIGCHVSWIDSSWGIQRESKNLWHPP